MSIIIKKLPLVGGVRVREVLGAGLGVGVWGVNKQVISVMNGRVLL